MLDDDELHRLTGFKRKGKQCAWLKRHGFKFHVNSHDQPRVSRAHFESKMGSTPKTAATGPAWGALGSTP